MATEYTPNVNLYKWKTTDSKQTTIQEMSSNAVKIDEKLNDHTVQLADIAIDVRTYGAKCDGVTDDTAAIQATIDAVTSGSTILVGSCKVLGKLTVTKHIKFKGSTHINGNYSGSFQTSKLDFPVSALPVCIDVTGGNVFFEDIVVSGNNQTIGINANNYTVTLNNAIIQVFQVGIQVTNGYYNKFNNSYIGYCDKPVILDHCYNTNFVNMSIKGNIDTITLKNNSNLNIFGGSIEQFTNFGLNVLTGSRAHLFGTYFEASNVTSFAVSLDANCSVETIGCHAYLTTIQKFIYSVSDNIRIYSRNNFFVYPSNTTLVKVYDFSTSTTNSTVDIAGDNWDTSAGVNVTYCPTAIFAQQGIFEIVYPPNHPNYSKNISTKNNVQMQSKTTPTVSTGTMVNFANAGFADDPLGIHTKAWGYTPYRAIYQKGQWEKVGARLPNQVNSTAVDVVTLVTDFNNLLQKLRDNGIMI